MDEKSVNESDALVKIYDVIVDEAGNIHKELIKTIPTKEERDCLKAHLEECKLKYERKIQLLNKIQLITASIGIIFSLLALYLHICRCR
ncbi:TPA: hypothetical protein K8N32_001320 [Clostridium perfringens]|nr:hypothetical protein [Clostridium perfringens]HBI7038383.1 hypothetical protein [Clostridium perfringens]